MKSYRKELCSNLPGRRAFINITPQVQDCLRESGIQEGLCLDNALNITSRIFINDDAGPRAVCTTAPERTPVLDERQAADAHLERAAQTGCTGGTGRDAERWSR